MNRNKWILLAIIAAAGVYFLTRSSTPKKETASKEDTITVVSSGQHSADSQPDIENYRLERENLAAERDLNSPRLKPEFKGAPEYKASGLRAKIATGPVDDFGAPMFVPSETAMTDSKIYEQELEKHKERSDAYAAARMDELRLNTEVEKNTMRTVIDQAKAQGSKSPEEIKRAEEAYARMDQLQKVLNGEKIENRLE